MELLLVENNDEGRNDFIFNDDDYIDEDVFSVEETDVVDEEVWRLKATVDVREEIDKYHKRGRRKRINGTNKQAETQGIVRSVGNEDGKIE